MSRQDYYIRHKMTDRNLYFHWDNDFKKYIIQHGTTGACLFTYKNALDLIKHIENGEQWEPILHDIAINNKRISLNNVEDFLATSHYKNYQK